MSAFMRKCFFFSFALPLVLIRWAVVVAQAQECSNPTDTCPSRYCSVTDGEDVCGSCLEHFVEYQENNCIHVDDINLDDFMKDFEPVYRDDDEGAAVMDSIGRLAVLLAAANFIADFNKENANNNSTYELGITRFSADTQREYKQRSGYFYVDVSGTTDALPSALLLDITQSLVAANNRLEEKVDWVERGAVTSVKDQGRCGCCWAVSLAGAVEGAAAVNNGYLQSVSFQQYISCNERNLGCDGGDLVVGMGYTLLNQFGGLTTMNDYEYTDYSGDTTEECQVENKPLAVSIEKPKIVLDFKRQPFTERLQLIKQVLNTQPISVAMKSSCRTLSNYRKGIMTDDGDCACSSLSCVDHAVLMVGYDDTSDPPSFKLKNSWGTMWGEDGYFRIAQTAKGEYGLFAILSHGVIPGLAYNVTGQVKDIEQDVPLKPWAIILIIGAVLLGCMCIVGAFKKMQAEREDRWGVPHKEGTGGFPTAEHGTPP